MMFEQRTGRTPSLFLLQSNSCLVTGAVQSNRVGASNIRMQKVILVTGGAGFIGSNFILQPMLDASAAIVNLDTLTYAGNLHHLESIAPGARYEFTHGDIGD